MLRSVTPGRCPESRVGVDLGRHLGSFLGRGSVPGWVMAPALWRDGSRRWEQRRRPALGGGAALGAEGAATSAGRRSEGQQLSSTLTPAARWAPPAPPHELHRLLRTIWIRDREQRERERENQSIRWNGGGLSLLLWALCTGIC
uniref:Uncharacterized protein n=1 Tax=Arundo donax TaxID=35708 RepID=A0A0A9E1F8_ARUDO